MFPFVFHAARALDKWNMKPSALSPHRMTDATRAVPKGKESGGPGGGGLVSRTQLRTTHRDAVTEQVSIR